MLKVNLTSLQSTPLSKPASFERNSSTSETDVTPNSTMMPMYYPMMYNQMAQMPGQPAYTHQMIPMSMQQPSMQTMATQAAPEAAQESSNFMSISPTMSGMTGMTGVQMTYTSESVYQLAQAGTPIVPAPAQPHVYHPQQTVVSVKPADQMNVFETSSWVRTLGELQGWPEALTYAQNFFNHGVSGIMLPRLDSDALEKHMGVEKHGHRLTLLSSIQSIFPHVVPTLQSLNSTMSTSGFSTAAPSTTGAESVTDRLSEADIDEGRPVLQNLQNSGRRTSMLVTPNRQLNERNLSVHDKLVSIEMRRPKLRDDDSSSRASVVSRASTMFSDSTTGRSILTDTTINSLNGDRRCHLMLTMEEAPVCNQEAILSIRKTFSSHGFDAHPRPSEKATNKFIVQFQNEGEAKRALEMKADIGYDLFSRKKGPRPTPSNPQQYMVLHHAQVRSGKSMKSKPLGFVDKGQVFWVNQIKGKRARLVDRSGDEDRNMGWVSLRNNAGYQLMAPFHE